jgi:FMN phosphatase YigB (HAD superfamily)
MKKITKLAIFDLDGTLLDTPLPEFGKQFYKEKTGQDWPFEGWWGKPLSLDMSIFEIPTVPQVIEDYQEEKKSDKTVTVMLTGRMTKLSDLVKDILKSKELTFDEYHFNRGGSTDVAKIKTMEKLLEKYTSVKEIEMWDDRLEHIPVFQEWGDKMLESGRLESFYINVVPADRH